MMHSMKTVNEVANIFPAVNPHGNGYAVTCPICGKENALHVNPPDDGKGIVPYCQHCKAPAPQIMQALGSQMPDPYFRGFEPTPAGGGIPYNMCPPKEPSAEEVMSNTSRSWEFCREHIYCDTGGQPLAKKMIWKSKTHSGKKTAFWFRYEKDQWLPKLPQGMELPLYRSDLLGQNTEKVLFIVEGEKDVDTLLAMGFQATTLPNSSAQSKWPQQYSNLLQNRLVVILTDNDDPGRKYGAFLSSHCLGLCQEVRLVPSESIWPELSETGDISDIVTALGKEKTTELLKETVRNATPLSHDWQKQQGFKTLNEIREQEATWLVDGWLPEGEIAVLAGNGGVGKTSFWLSLVAALSSGKSCIFDDPNVPHPPRKPMQVAFFSAEDSVSKRILKKIRLAGGNQENIITMDTTAENMGKISKFKFGSPELMDFIRTVRPKLCVFDPIQAFVPPKTNMSSRSEMRECLAPMIRLGEKCGTTFLLVCHTNKRKDVYARDRIADSADIWDIARSVMMVGMADDGNRYLSNEKNSYDDLQETILFDIDNDGRPIFVGKSWKRDCEFVKSANANHAQSKVDDCMEFIMQQLDGGKMSANELDHQAKGAGFSAATLRRAKEALKESGKLMLAPSGSKKDGDFKWLVIATMPHTTQNTTDITDDADLPL